MFRPLVFALGAAVLPADLAPWLLLFLPFGWLFTYAAIRSGSDQD